MSEPKTQPWNPAGTVPTAVDEEPELPVISDKRIGGEVDDDCDAYARLLEELAEVAPAGSRICALPMQTYRKGKTTS